jgi:hypothetical protein
VLISTSCVFFLRIMPLCSASAVMQQYSSIQLLAGIPARRFAFWR